jgi:jasmonate O-methyltransferase
MSELANKSKTYSIILNDLPHNDWNSVFKTFTGFSQKYNNGKAHVHLYGSPASFYKPIVPDKSVHFGISGTAFHWLTSIPMKIDNHIHVHAKGFRQDGPIFKAWAKK